MLISTNFEIFRQFKYNHWGSNQRCPKPSQGVHLLRKNYGRIYIVLNYQLEEQHLEIQIKRR
jgi:hypothetical protein